MEMIALILSGLALLAAGVCLCLLMQEKKRNQERNAAMLDFVQVECNAVSTASGAYTDEMCRKTVLEISGRVENLEKGIIPDYEKATAAVNAVNDFNQGISNLLNYDPVSALAAQREKERTGA